MCHNVCLSRGTKISVVINFSVTDCFQKVCMQTQTEKIYFKYNMRDTLWQNSIVFYPELKKCFVCFWYILQMSGNIFHRWHIFKFCLPQDEQKEILSDKFRCDGDCLFQKKKAAQIERQREKLIKFYIRLSHHFVTKINSPGFSLTDPGDYPARKNLSYVFIFMYSYYILTFGFRKFILSPFCSKSLTKKNSGIFQHFWVIRSYSPFEVRLASLSILREKEQSGSSKLGWHVNFHTGFERNTKHFFQNPMCRDFWNSDYLQVYLKWTNFFFDYFQKSASEYKG